MKVELEEYIDSRDRNHYRKWLSDLDPSVRARVIKCVLRMEKGNFSDVKPEGEGVSALRLDFGPGYRVYFGKVGELLVILLAGGTKKRQSEDIKFARSLWAEYKAWKRQKQKEN